jgi:hypothetical protein
MSSSATQIIIRNFIEYLPYAMGFVFLVAAVFRWAIYYTISRHELFAREFEKRVYRYLDKPETGAPNSVSFYVLAKKLLEKTYYETFAARDRKVRENADHVMGLGDRVFFIKQGCAWFVNYTLKQIKHLKWSKESPKLQTITRTTLNHNPCFNKVFGIFPLGGVNDIISILPGLFVVAGILGTFLGIKGGLGQLGGLDLGDIENSKTLMDSFLHEIGFAMSSSIFGITLSLLLHVFNTSYSPERVYISLVDRFESALDMVWYRSDNNTLPDKIENFNENRDPVEALAEEALRLEVTKSQRELAQKIA